MKLPGQTGDAEDRLRGLRERPRDEETAMREEFLPNQME
jgi:hypothetical protein